MAVTGLPALWKRFLEAIDVAMREPPVLVPEANQEIVVAEREEVASVAAMPEANQEIVVAEREEVANVAAIMTKEGLLNAIKAKFPVVLLGSLVQNPPDAVRDADGKIITVLMEHWAVPVFDKVGDVLVRRWVLFYVDPQDGSAYWQDQEPKPTPAPPVPTFTAKLQQYLDAAAVVGTPIKAGAILWSSDAGRVAKLEVVTTANALKQAIITANVDLTFNPPVILA